MDQFGNINAGEGCDRCHRCGTKYWEFDACAACGLLWEISEVRKVADVSRYMLEVSLNVMLTSLCHTLGMEAVHSLDLVDTTNKYRAMGVIQ